MKRRKFLYYMGGGLISGAIASVSVPSFNKVVENIIYEDSKGLKISQDTYAQFFSTMYEESNWGEFGFSKRQFLTFHYLFNNKLINLPFYHKYVQMRSYIMGKFLLSTDFFINKMDESGEVNFIALYDPYKRPCSNPFSSIFYDRPVV